MITATQLKLLRTQRGMTRNEMAALLGCTPHQLVHWESGDRNIPHWVTEKIYGSLAITLPLTDLQTLMVHAQKTGVDLATLLTRCIRTYLDQTREQSVSTFIQTDTQDTTTPTTHEPS